VEASQRQQERQPLSLLPLESWSKVSVRRAFTTHCGLTALTTQATLGPTASRPILIARWCGVRTSAWSKRDGNFVWHQTCHRGASSTGHVKLMTPDAPSAPTTRKNMHRTRGAHSRWHQRHLRHLPQHQHLDRQRRLYQHHWISMDSPFLGKVIT